MSTKEARDRAQAKYNDKRGMRGLHIKLYEDTDKDIIDKLESVESKQTYIKDLIRKDIKGDIK